MGKGVIDFHYDSGKSYTKKRKRIPGANPVKKPEIKQFNPKDGSGTFDAITFSPLVIYNQAVSNAWLPWRLQPLSWPSQGALASQRIGNSFFLKAIRFKGYVSINRNVIKPVRWRLRLVRLEKPIPDFLQTANYSGHTHVYLKLFKNYQEFNQGINPIQVIDTCRHNFYKMIKNLPKDRPWTSKVIASGMIPANNQMVSQGTFEYGQTNTFHVTTEVNAYETGVACIPIDVLVKCNDRITYSLDDTQTTINRDIVYCLVLEDDCGVGYDVIKASFTPATQSSAAVTTAPVINYNAYQNECYNITLFCRGYFKDD